MALAHQDDDLSDAENLEQLLASHALKVEGTTINETKKVDSEFTHADYSANISLSKDLLTKDGRAGMKQKLKDLGNLKKHLQNTATGVVGAFNTSSNALESIYAAGKYANEGYAASHDHDAPLGSASAKREHDEGIVNIFKQKQRM